MHQSVLLHECAIALQKGGARKALGHLLHLRVREGEPHLAHLARGKEAVDELDVGAQEAHILHACSHCLLGSRPHACSLDIHSDIVLVGEHPSQPHRVFASSAAQLEHDGLVVVEEVGVPLPLQVKPVGLENRKWTLHHQRIGCHVGKLSQLSLAHAYLLIVYEAVPMFCPSAKMSTR